MDYKKKYKKYKHKYKKLIGSSDLQGPGLPPYDPYIRVPGPLSQYHHLRRLGDMSMGDQYHTHGFLDYHQNVKIARENRQFINIRGLLSCVGIFVYFLDNNRVIQVILGLHFVSQDESRRELDFLKSKILEYSNIYPIINTELYCNRVRFGQDPSNFNSLRNNLNDFQGQNNINLNLPVEPLLTGSSIESLGVGETYF